jgi:hypothetical protein
MANSIHNLDTKIFENNTGTFPAIVMGLNILDSTDEVTFFDSVVEKWKCQRMSSPPETANMTITLVGYMTAARFRDLWMLRSGVDPVLKHFMSLMVHADVLHVRGRELLDRASLLIARDERTDA